MITAKHKDGTPVRKGDKVLAAWSDSDKSYGLIAAIGKPMRFADHDYAELQTYTIHCKDERVRDYAAHETAGLREQIRSLADAAYRYQQRLGQTLDHVARNEWAYPPPAELQTQLTEARELLAAEREQLAAVREENERMAESLKSSAKTFRWYAQLHWNNSDAEKAKRNEEFAEVCEKALATCDAAVKTEQPKYEEYKTVIENRDFEKHPLSKFEIECVNRPTVVETTEGTKGGG